MQNPFSTLTKKEWILWMVSLAVTVGSNFFTPQWSIVTTVSTAVGVTSLIFVAKGDPLGQALGVVFSILYAVTSLQYHYYGEAITYLFMSGPISAASFVAWLKHPFRKGENEVRIHHLSVRQRVWLVISALLVTAVLGWLLWLFETPNLPVSILSITTSYVACYLLLFRSPYYAVVYGLNDVVLIALWILASIEDLSYLPMILCFLMFLLNDIYGFLSWRSREKKQKQRDAAQNK